MSAAAPAPEPAPAPAPVAAAPVAAPPSAPAAEAPAYLAELDQLAALHSAGVLTDEEYEEKKHQVLGL